MNFPSIAAAKAAYQEYVKTADERVNTNPFSFLRWLSSQGHTYPGLVQTTTTLEVGDSFVAPLADNPQKGGWYLIDSIARDGTVHAYRADLKTKRSRTFSPLELPIRDSVEYKAAYDQAAPLVDALDMTDSRFHWNIIDGIAKLVVAGQLQFVKLPVSRSRHDRQR